MCLHTLSDPGEDFMLLLAQSFKVSTIVEIRALTGSDDFKLRTSCAMPIC